MNSNLASKDFLHRYGPWALVAGASKGLGAEFAAQLARCGLNLVLIARDAEALQSLSGQLSTQSGIQVRTLAIDLASEDSANRIVEQTADLEIGLLVYNAAYSAIGAFFDISLDTHLREIATNVRAPLSLAYLLGQKMASRGGGGMIFMSSLAAAQGSAYISNYAATKAYNLILGEGLWEELRDQGIDVLASCPSAVSTPNYQRSLEKDAAEEDGKKAPVSTMSPQAVVAETLAALGKRPSIIPGRSNRAAAFMMQRIIPRPVAIRLMGRVLRNMYT